jgi:hypothetical protein
MVNKSKSKGTIAENLVVGYLCENGWPHAERRALAGILDRGDVAGCPGLAIEVKWGNETLKIASWLAETGIERLNANADHGILVVKPFGLGMKNAGSFYAIMVSADFDRLVNQVQARPDPGVFVIHGQPYPYSARTLAQEVRAGVTNPRLASREVFAVALKPPGTKDKPEKWYRVMTLHHMTRLLRAAGYGEPIDDRDPAAPRRDGEQTPGD